MSPCLEEIPKFNKLIDEININKTVDIVFIASSSDDKKTILKYVKQYEELKSIIIPNSLSFLRIILASKSGFPTIIVVDKKGIIKEYYLGGIRDFSKFKDELMMLAKDEQLSVTSDDDDHASFVSTTHVAAPCV